MQKAAIVLVNLSLWTLLFPSASFAESPSSLTTDITAQGPLDAPITIVEFSDLQCPFCARVAPTVEQVMKAYPGQVRWVFKHYPLSTTDTARGMKIPLGGVGKIGRTISP